MSLSPLDLYGEGLQGSPSTRLRYEDGHTAPLDIARWVGDLSPADDALLARCAGPTLDIGCGPGRLTRALVERGVDCLGVDVAPVAVDLARTGGTPVLHASIYDGVLDDTRWATVLLADGNVGIEGDPVALLLRARALTHPGGNVLVELDPPGSPTRRVRVRLEAGDRTSSWFPWAHVGVDDIAAVAADARLDVTETWTLQDRWFAELRGAA